MTSVLHLEHQHDDETSENATRFSSTYVNDTKQGERSQHLRLLLYPVLKSYIKCSTAPTRLVLCCGSILSLA